MATSKKYAAVKSPTIAAALKSLYRFASKQQALDRIDQLKSHFVTSHHESPPDTTVMWIRGYALTDADIEQGIMGNFGIISCIAAGNKFTLQITKLELDISLHPQRKRPKKKHPDWGYPILRDIKKKRIFSSIESATDELRKLHEAFPEVSIPGDTVLMIIIYEKIKGVKSPVQKYKLEVQAHPDAGFWIMYKRNNKPAKPMASTNQPIEDKGYFTSMVKLKRKRSAPKPKG